MKRFIDTLTSTADFYKRIRNELQRRYERTGKYPSDGYIKELQRYADHRYELLEQQGA